MRAAALLLALLGTTASLRLRRPRLRPRVPWRTAVAAPPAIAATALALRGGSQACESENKIIWPNPKAIAF